MCGEQVTVIGATLDGRLIGSCKDAFTEDQWEDEDTDDDEPREPRGCSECGWLHGCACRYGTPRDEQDRDRDLEQDRKG